MIASNQEARKCSDKKMEGDDGLRTMECLRGRLLAERHASKVAKEDAELIGNKLIELENQIRVETKLRNKAEKKLKFLKKKLESLKISPILKESEQSSSSKNCAFSGGSYTSASGSKEPVDQKPRSQMTNPVTSQNLYHNVADITAPNQSHESSSIDENSSSQDTANSDTKHPSLENPSDKSSTRRDQDAKTDNYLSSSSLKASITEMEINGRNESDSSDDYVDNSLALVPVDLLVESTKRSREVKIVKTSVGEVLDALRHAREKIQNSMERREMIRVGPSRIHKW